VGVETDGIAGFVLNILFTCGLGQRNWCSDLLRPGDPEDQIQVRERYIRTQSKQVAWPTQPHVQGYRIIPGVQ